MPLVVGDPVRLQEGDEFVLKGNLAMVLLLVANILHHRGYVGLADAEGRRTPFAKRRLTGAASRGPTGKSWI